MSERIACDVLVVGGGPAGLGAALGAARCGSVVVLLEKNGFLGGLATAGQVGTICGLPPPEGTIATPFSSLGFVRAWVDSLARASGTQVARMPGGLSILPFHPWDFQRLADDLVSRPADLLPVLHAVLISVTVDSGHAVGAEALVSGRMVTLRTKSLVDCTGMATAVHLAGGGIVEEDSPQPSGVIFSMEGVAETLQDLGVRLSSLREISRAGQTGRLSPTCASASFVPGSIRDNRVDIKLSLIPGPEVTHWQRITQMEISARREVEELRRFLTTELPPFRHSHLGRMATQVGVRIPRRALGRRTLSETDVLDCGKFDDGVAWGTWPVEEWDPEGRPHITHLCNGEYYEIPVGCLHSADLENVWMAGRCMSAGNRALASARVIGTALNTGWAAGIAAAFQAGEKPLTEAVECARGHFGGDP